MVYVIAITLVCWHAPGRCVRLFDKTSVLKLTHDISDRCRAPTRSIFETSRQYSRSNSLASHEVFLDDRREHCFAASVRHIYFCVVEIDAATGHYVIMDLLFQ